MKKFKFNGENKEELLKILKDKKENLRNFRFGLAGSKVRDVKEGRALRKDIARILTKLSKLKQEVKNG